jgi:hypothetical protein
VLKIWEEDSGNLCINILLIYDALIKNLLDNKNSGKIFLCLKQCLSLDFFIFGTLGPTKKYDFQ